MVWFLALVIALAFPLEASAFPARTPMVGVDAARSAVPHDSAIASCIADPRSEDAPAACRDPRLVTVAMPLLYAYTKDMLMIWGTLALIALVISAQTDDPELLANTYLFVGLAGTFLVPAAVGLDWHYALNLAK